jgi:hypothetical protein
MFGNRKEIFIPPTRLGPEVHSGYKDLVQAAFITLRSGMMLVSTRQDLKIPGWSDKTLDEYDQCAVGRNFGEMGMLPLKNGVVLTKVTKGGLVDYSHRLKVPLDGSLASYHRDAFNVDSQCVPGPAINLSGEEEIAKNPEAVIQVLSFERDVIYHTHNNWEGYELRHTGMRKC